MERDFIEERRDAIEAIRMQLSRLDAGDHWSIGTKQAKPDDGGVCVAGASRQPNRIMMKRLERLADFLGQIWGQSLPETKNRIPLQECGLKVVHP